VVNGGEAHFIGEGDLHDTKYESMGIREVIIAIGDEDHDKHQCFHTFYIYPSDELQSTYESNKPVQYTVIVVAIFVFCALLFFVYDYLMTDRQRQTSQIANKSTAILQELFPGSVAAQLFDKDKKDSRGNKERETFGDSRDSEIETGKSIAEFYPEATVLFADIAGFTAWSSIREPQSVFTLLENIFQGFDILAKKHGVFKVETIGDCK